VALDLISSPSFVLLLGVRYMAGVLALASALFYLLHLAQDV